MTQTDLDIWKQSVFDTVNSVFDKLEDRIIDVERSLHDIKYANLLEDIEARLDKLEEEDRSYICHNHEELKFLARIRRIEDRMEELSGIVKEFFSKDTDKMASPEVLDAHNLLMGALKAGTVKYP